MIQVVYLMDRNVICVGGIPTPFPAGSLEARRLGDLLAIASPHQDTLICDWAAAPLWSDASGTAFQDADAAFAYLAATCSRQPGVEPTVSATAALDAAGLPKGMPVALSRANGQMQAARADSYALSFVSGLAETDIAAGFPATAVRTYVDRADWADVAGSQALALGQPYFLGLTGGITLTPDRTAGNCLVRVGIAALATRLAFIPSDPILL